LDCGEGRHRPSCTRTWAGDRGRAVHGLSRGTPTPARRREGGRSVKEREAKLAAPPWFELPRLGGPEEAFVAEPQGARRLQTTYYDTADLRLARWGASLRFRPGEGWTVKLPEGQDGALLVRAGHGFPGDG